MVNKTTELYSGKSKTLYLTDNTELLWCEFRDDATAGNGQKHAQLANKGLVNNYINSSIMHLLASQGVLTHFVERVSDTASLVKKLKMIPLECVVRNVAAGGIVKRLGVTLGQELNPATFEFFLKNDALGDPIVNESHIITFGWASLDQISQMKLLTHQVNNILKPFFEGKGLILVDYKLEFGVLEGKLVLADEFTPDGCRLWDKATKKILDKDRFRQDLGDVISGYQEVAHRLNISLPI